jgi:hypothetical protein
MIKYTDKQKLGADKAYGQGTGGLRATAKAQGVGVDSLRSFAGWPMKGCRAGKPLRSSKSDA